VTPDVVCTQRRAARSEAVDLSAIRRTDALIDLLASRRLLRPRSLGDPVITLLSSLNSDVDEPARAPRRLAGGVVARPRGRRIGAGLLGRSHGGGPAAGPPGRPRVVAASRPARRLGAPVPGAHRYQGAHRRNGGPWVRALAAAMVFIAVAVTAAGLMVAGMLTRLTGASGGRESR
jgi:hypothetical protein